MLLNIVRWTLENPSPLMLSKVLAFTDQLKESSTGSFDRYAGDLTYFQILISLSLAAVLGALIAYHPWRQIEVDGPVKDRELKKTLILIAVAGAIMVALIQGSLERAFGLVGLGSFVRYRTSLRNPADLSIIFILIGLGMACGLQFYEFAITITGFIYLLLFMPYWLE